MIGDDVGAEQRRLAEADSGERGWRSWGPYLSERAWATVRARLRWFLTNKPGYGDVVGAMKSRGGQQMRLLSMVGPDQLIRILQRMLDEEEFLSAYGLSAVSRSPWQPWGGTGSGNPRS